MQFNRRLNPVGHCHNQNFEQEKTEKKEPDNRRGGRRKRKATESRRARIINGERCTVFMILSRHDSVCLLL